MDAAIFTTQQEAEKFSNWIHCVMSADPTKWGELHPDEDALQVDLTKKISGYTASRWADVLTDSLGVDPGFAVIVPASDRRIIAMKAAYPTWEALASQRFPGFSGVSSITPNEPAEDGTSRWQAV